MVSRGTALGRKARADRRVVMAASTLAASITGAAAGGFWLMGVSCFDVYVNVNYDKLPRCLPGGFRRWSARCS